MNVYRAAEFPPDPLDLAMARAEYGEATRELLALRAEAAKGPMNAGQRERLGTAQDRVARAAARLANLTGRAL